MKIKSRLSEKDLINVNFVLLFSKTSIKIIIAIALFSLITTILSSIFSSHFEFSQFIIAFGMLTVFPLLTFYGAKRNYATNQRIRETIEYEFDTDKLIVRGESFYSDLSWDKIYKVSKTKNWILIWINKQIANPISIVKFSNENLETLKIILEKHKIKNNI